MTHIGVIAGRELRSYFVSPVAYAVLVLFALLSGFFFVMQVRLFQEVVSYYQQLQQFEALREVTLNNFLLYGYYQTVWLVFLFLAPALTMGLFTHEKQNGTQELLLTSPIALWELVLGKYLAAAAMMTLLVLVLLAHTAILFVYGDPEPAHAAAALLGLWLIGLGYAAIGAFASSLTRSPLIAFFLSFVLLLLLFLVGQIADIGMATAAGAPGANTLLELLRWLSSDRHLEEMLRGAVNTSSLAYFGFVIAGALVLTRAVVESARWR